MGAPLYSGLPCAEKYSEQSTGQPNESRCHFCGHSIYFDRTEQQWLDSTGHTHFCIGARSHKNRHAPSPWLSDDSPPKEAKAAPPPSEGAELPPLEDTDVDRAKAFEWLEDTDSHGPAPNLDNIFTALACRERQLAQALAERDAALEKLAISRRTSETMLAVSNRNFDRFKKAESSLSAARREIEELASEKRTVQLMLSDVYKNVADLQAQAERMKGGSE